MFIYTAIKGKNWEVPQKLKCRGAGIMAVALQVKPLSILCPVTGIESSLSCMSSCLLMHILGDKRWWYNYLYSCHTIGKPTRDFRLLDLLWPSSDFRYLGSEPVNGGCLSSQSHEKEAGWKTAYTSLKQQLQHGTLAMQIVASYTDHNTGSTIILLLVMNVIVP